MKKVRLLPRLLFLTLLAVVVASAFYLALRPALEHAGLLKKAV